MCIRDDSGPNDSRKGASETNLFASGRACVNETLLCESKKSYINVRIWYCYNATAVTSAVDRMPQNLPSCSAFRPTLLSCIPFQSVHSDHRNVVSDSLRYDKRFGLDDTEQSTASSSLQYPLVFLRSSSNCLRLLPRLPVTSILPSIFPCSVC